MFTWLMHAGRKLWYLMGENIPTGPSWKIHLLNIAYSELPKCSQLASNNMVYFEATTRKVVISAWVCTLLTLNYIVINFFFFSFFLSLKKNLQK